MGFLLASKLSKSLNIAWSLVMIILAILAYLSLSSPPNHLRDLLDNWQQSPIYALKTVPKTQSCPFGWETISRVGHWPGSVAGCYCSSSNSLRQGFCADSDLSQGCVDVPETTPFDLQSWRGRILCLWRGGTAVYYASAYDSNAADHCPSKTDIYGNTVLFRACGSGLGSHCAEEGLSCPVSSMQLQGPGQPTPTGFPFAEYFGESQVLYYSNDDSSPILPIIDITITRGPVCFEDPGDEGFPDTEIYPLLAAAQDLCTYNDSRYIVLDQIAEAEYFKDNDFEGVVDLPGLGLKTDRNWVLAARRSIEWMPHCTQGSFSMLDVNDHRDPLPAITRVQIALLVAVCVLCGYLLLPDPLLNCFCYAKSPDDISEFDAPLRGMFTLERLVKLLLLPFTIAAVWIVTYHHNWFQDLTQKCCSDPLTNASFDFVYFATNDTFLIDWAIFSLNLVILLADSVFGITVFILRTKENFR